MRNINSIQLKRKKKNTVTIFPGHEANERKQAAEKYIQKVNEDRGEKFKFIQSRLETLRKEFKNVFNCDADYFIFNSIKWE
jgi:hypothetical protein